MMYYSYDRFRTAIPVVLADINLQKVKYDYICGIVRGGLIPATVLSYNLKIPMFTIDISLRDRTALTIPPEAKKIFEKSTVLICDDIIDSGDTIRRIATEIDIRNHDCFGVVYNTESGVPCRYYTVPIARSKDKRWVSFFWDKE